MQTFLPVLDWASAPLKSHQVGEEEEPRWRGQGGRRKRVAVRVWPEEGQLACCVAGAAVASLQP